MCGTARGHAGYGAQETRQAESSSGGTPLPSDIGICVPTLQSDTCRTSALERDKAAKHCCVHLPDGTSCVVAVKSGFSIKEILSGLCERHGINGAAVDLFLVGGDKVLCQTGMSHRYPGPVYSLPSGLVSAHSCHHHYPLPVKQCSWKWRLPGGRWVHGSTTCCLEGVRLILKLLFCSCSCVLLHVKPTCSHVNSGVFVPQPLVLHQDSSILATRDLRLEKRTLFR